MIGCLPTQTLAFLAVFVYATQAIAFEWKPGLSRITSVFPSTLCVPLIIKPLLDAFILCCWAFYRLQRLRRNAKKNRPKHILFQYFFSRPTSHTFPHCCVRNDINVIYLLLAVCYRHPYVTIQMVAFTFEACSRNSGAVHKPANTLSISAFIFRDYSFIFVIIRKNPDLPVVSAFFFCHFVIGL